MSTLTVAVLQRLIKDNILASETIAIVLPTIALVPCTIYSSIIRNNPSYIYTTCVKNGVLPYLPEIKIGSYTIYEPFSTTTNLAYIMSGIGIYLYYIPNRAFVHMQMYIVGILFILLGTGSVAMHAAGSKIGGWEHAVDIFSIYAFFTGLTGSSILGLYHTIVAKPLLPTSLDIIPPVINTLTLLGIGFTILLWNRINQANFLVGTSVVIIISNATTQGIFSVKSIRNAELNKLGCFVSSFMVSAIPRAIVLLAALYVNLKGRVIPGDLQRKCKFGDMENYDYNKELVTRFDWQHGIWHYLSAIALTGMALSAQQGLDGVTEERLGIENTRLPCVKWLIPFAIKTDEYVEELISRFIISAFCLSVILMFELEVTARTWEVFLLSTSLTILPSWCIYACYSIYKCRNTVLVM